MCASGLLPRLREGIAAQQQYVVTRQHPCPARIGKAPTPRLPHASMSRFAAQSPFKRPKPSASTVCFDSCPSIARQPICRNAGRRCRMKKTKMIQETWTLHPRIGKKCTVPGRGFSKDGRPGRTGRGSLSLSCSMALRSYTRPPPTTVPRSTFQRRSNQSYQHSKGQETWPSTSPLLGSESAVRPLVDSTPGEQFYKQLLGPLYPTVRLARKLSRDNH